MPPDPQKLIDETIAAGGFGFLAHPHEKDLPIVNEPNLGWHDWEIDGFTGLEIWNYMSSMKNRLADAIKRSALAESPDRQPGRRARRA